MDLRAPVRREPPLPDLELRPRQLKKWVESLPIHVTFESTRAVTRHVVAVNRAHVEVATRVEILEVQRAAASRLLADLEATYASAPLPLGPGPRAALGLARELLIELAIGHRLAINDSRGKLFATKKQLGTLLKHAMFYTVARLYAAYKSYTPVPVSTWEDLHELYLRGEALGVDLGEAYRDALLLSLTDPYRLTQGEATQVLTLLGQHRGLAKLGKARPATPPGGHFIVPCNTDKPPKPSIGKLDDTGGPDWRILDANAIVERLRANKDGLAARLATLWGDPPKRASRREAGQATVAISMGIDGVGHFVALEPQVDAARQQEMLRKGITMPLMPLPMNDQSEPIPVFEWDVVNQSHGGLRVRRLGRTDQPIAVGEVAGIKLPGKPHWAIGAVRWITVFEDGGMEFGLQYLAQMARAVTVAAWGAPSGTGLLMSDGDGAATLLTSPNAFSHMQDLEIEDRGDAVLVHPSGVVEITHRFEIFSVKTD